MSTVDPGTEGTTYPEQIAARDQLLLELGRAAAAQERRIEELTAELEGQTGTFKATLDGISDAVMVVDENGTVIHLNAAAEQIVAVLRNDGAPTGEDWRYAPGIYRADMVTPYPPDEIPLTRALRGENVHNEELYLRWGSRAEGRWLETSARPIRIDGKHRGAVTVFRDIGERKRWEREMEQQLVREKEKNDLCERMQGAIQQLSTPILEVWDDILAVPIIGVVDSMRASDMMERVLGEVERKQCRFLIIDITGVDIIDTATADRFVKLVTAVEILGARCFLTGARAVVAQTLASLGLDLGRLTTLRNLKHALGECIRLMDDGARQPQIRDLFARRGARS
jgi:rsbT co-antagonist protein RsbR